VDITPVSRNGLAGRFVLQKSTHHEMLPSPLRTEREEVITLALHADAKLNRLDSTLLAKDTAKTF
jgi:hypothetical protein